MGVKAVVKNNAAGCVLLDSDEYICLMDEVNDAYLLAVVSERMANYDPDTLIPEEVWEHLGTPEEDLRSIGEIEIE